MITAFVFLNPEFAFWALFEFFAFHKTQKFIVFLIVCARNLIFFATHISVPFSSTIQTVFFMTFWASKPGIIILLIEKHIPTICSGTPRDRVTVHIRIEFQSVLLIFYVEFRI